MAGWFLKNLGVVFVGWFGRCSFILRCQKDHRMIISDWSLWEAVNDLSVWWSGTRRVTMLRLREWNWNIYIYIQGTLILRSRCISTYDVLLRLTKKNHGTAVEPWSLEPHGSACLVTSKVSSLHPYRWRLTSFIVWSPGGCHQDTGLSSSVSSWESCWDVHGETRRKTTGCGCYIALFWVLLGDGFYLVCVVFCSHPLGKSWWLVCVCVFFFPLPWHLFEKRAIFGRKRDLDGQAHEGVEYFWGILPNLQSPTDRMKLQKIKR